MKNILITIAVLVLAGCGESQQYTSTKEAKPVDPDAEVPAKPPFPKESQPAEPVAEVPSQPSPSLITAKPVEPFVEAELPDSLPVKSTDISIWDAARTGNILSVKQLLKTGTGVNAVSEDGWTPLHWAAWMGHKEVSKLLIEKGADSNATSHLLGGITPLHWAARGGHEEIVELLVANGADVNTKTDDGHTPLDVAFTSQSLLRKHGGKTGEELKAEGK